MREAEGLPTPAQPRSVAEARELLRRGRLKDARAASNEISKAAPDDVAAAVLALEVVAESGRPAIAILGLEQLRARHGDRPDAVIALARSLAAVGDQEGTARATARALELAPAQARERIDLADLCARQGNAGMAEALLRRAVADAEEDPASHLALAELLAHRDGATEEAREHMRRAVELDPSLEMWHFHVAMTYRRQDRPDASLRALERGLALQPGAPHLSYMLHAAKGSVEVGRAPDAYVVEHFDRFAETFDELLLGNLEYRTPAALVAVAAKAVPRPDGLTVLDAGCGTGLCGPLLRPLAERLDGVDLSSKMLERAAAREVYDDLAVEELTAALLDRVGRYDLIVAADVLVYFGDLHGVIAAAASALRPGGVLAFSVERSDGPAHQLAPTGRFSHSREHLAEVCAAAGLSPEFTESKLRLEGGKPIQGYLVAARCDE